MIIAGLLAVLALGAAAILAGGAPVRQASRLAAVREPAGPSAASLAASRGLGSDQRAFWVARSRNGLGAVNGAQRMRAEFSAEGVRVSVPGGFAGLSLRAFGREGSLAPISPVRPVAITNRVSYAHGGLTEWYANGPLGLEQGITLKASPAGAARSGGELSLSYGLTGAAARLQDRQLTFTGAHGTALLRYGGLSATDSLGRVLPSRLALDGGRLLLSVDARGARYPITIDPLIQAATLTADDSAQGSEFGGETAVSGSTLVVSGMALTSVGEPADSNAGALYVFTEPKSGWANAAQVAKLTASTANPSEELGISVAISGNTIYAIGYNGTTGQGLVYVYAEPPGGWTGETQTETAVLRPPQSTESFSQVAVSPSASGDTVFAGAPDANSEQGAVLVYKEPAGGWTASASNEADSAVLTPSDAGGEVGGSLAVSGQTLAAGAPTAGADAGAVYVFQAPWTTGSQPVELTAPEDNGGLFGQIVATDGSTIAAAAPLQTIGSNVYAGAVYVFSRPPSGVWANSSTPAAELTGSGEPADTAGGHLFGLRLAVGQFPANATNSSAPAGETVETVFVGTGDGSGIFAFAEPASGWQTASAPALLGLASASTFSLTLDGNYLLEGQDNSRNEDTANPTYEPGSVNVFDTPGSIQTSVSCVPNPVAAAASTSCTATVTDESANAPSAPSGSVTFSSSATGGSFSGSPCTLAPQTASTAGCAVSYKSATVGAQTISAAYGGDLTHAPGASATSLNVVSTGSSAPVETSPPTISGTPLPGDTITCRTGSWTNGPTSFSYQWYRDGSPIAGATKSTYVVQIGDEAKTLSCKVKATGAGGTGTAAGSVGALVAMKGTLDCPMPRGRLSGISVGPLRLGMTSTEARHKLHRVAVTHYGFDDFCLYAGWGIRVGYPSKKLLGRLAAGRRAHLRGRIVLALTANPFYALHGVKPGMSLAAAKRKLKLGKVFHIGLNDWYLATGKTATGVLKVRHNVVQEIGLANPQLTAARANQHRFLTSFKAG